jgi:hypothetical protein
VIVEGDDDISFFRHHCMSDVMIRESFKGKSGVYQILEFFSDRNQVIGICDRDYDNAKLPAHIFCYDFSCLETMLFSDTKTTEVIFTQLNIKGSISLEELLRQLLWISYLRKMNFFDNLAIKFDGLRISKIFNSDCGIKNDILIEELQKINDNTALLNADQIESIKTIAHSDHTLNDLLVITQGHDLISLVQCYHKSYVPYKGRTMSEGDIRALLYCTYVERFETSKLYSDVLQYGQAVNINFWKA